MTLFSLVFLQASSNPIVGFLPLILIVGIFYLLVFMPMQRQKKQQQELLKNLQNGNIVITTGGIVGTIASISGDTLILRVKPDNLKLQFTRASISGLAPEEKKE
jgi:preprotein translocase subunit YajC